LVPRVIRTFGGIRIDTTEWPIIMMDCGTFRDADADLQAALDCVEQVMRECTKTREKCVQVTDLSAVQRIPTAVQRKIAGDWVKATVELQKATSLGGANVTPSSIIRGIVTAISWLQRPPTPLKYFATRAEATLQALKWLEEGHVLLPPALRQLHDRLTTEARDREQQQAAAWGRRRGR
jgi:hypothetical protein